MPVLDTSVVVAGLKTSDAHSPAARRWLSGSTSAGQQWHVPSILLAELGAAITRGSPDSADSEAAEALFLSTPFLTVWPVTIELAARAARIARNQRIRGCDAVFVALAEELGDVLVTFDLQQANRAREIIEVLVPS